MPMFGQKKAEYNRKYKEANREKLADDLRKWRAANPEKKLAHNAKYREANREKIRESGREYQRERYDANREKAREYQREWNRANPEKRRATIHLSRYGVPLSWKAETLELQGGVCAICGSDDPGAKAGWSTDHCHANGKLREVLCQPCNLKLGAYEKNRALYDRFDEYLSKWKEIHASDVEAEAG